MLSDREIKRLIEQQDIVVEPFSEELVSSNGLELRLGDEACRLLDRQDILLDPEEGAFKIVVDPEEGVYRAEDFYECSRGSSIIFRPNSKYLVKSLEIISFSPQVAAIIGLRSTWARTGFMLPPTLVDAGYKGQLTVLISTPSFPVRLREGVRFFHLAVFRLNEEAEKAYNGSYQGLTGISLPKFFRR